MGNRGTGKTGKRRTRCSSILLLTFFTAPFLVVPHSPPLFPFCPFLHFARFPVPLVLSARAERNDSTVVSTTTREGRLTVFDDAWQTIHDRYYDPDFRGLDWDAQRTTFRTLAAEATNSQELYGVLHRMVDSLNDAHTHVYAPEEKFDWWNPRFVSIGLTLRDVEGLPTVVQVEHGSAPEHAGVRPGDVIASVNGEPAAALIQRRLTEKSRLSSPASASSRVVAKLMEGTSETSVQLQWQGQNGKVKSARFQRHWQQRQLGLRIRRAGRKYAVIEIDAFTQSIARDFAGAFKEKLQGTRGILIDLRENGGGDAEAMSEIASSFLEEGISLGQFSDRWGSNFNIATRANSLFGPEPIVQTRLPLIVLTSDRTSSAAEIFVAALKLARRTTVIGTETCGCVLAIRARHTLPDGGGLDVSELDYRTAEGSRLEGQGTRPDELVRLERRDLYAGRDRFLEAALERLERLRRGHHSHSLVRALP
jgi:C-terminal peptidase prc